MIVALPDKDIDAATLKGGLQSVSPEEEIHAWVWAVHRDLKARNEAALSEWRDKALSQPMVFEVMASDDV